MSEVEGNGNGHATEPELRALESELRTLETAIMLSRAQFATQHGLTFGGDRDEYAVLGYPRYISTREYREEYERGGIAGRVVDVMPEATWRGDPAFEVIEDEDPEVDTAFEKTWNEFQRQHQVTNKLLRVDKLARLTNFAVLLIGAPGDLEQELPKGKPGGVLYLVPFSGGGVPGSRGPSLDSDASIYEFETDVRNKRFGLPRSYSLRRTDSTSPQLARPVHWSRIIHVAEGLLDDEVFGQPALQRIWNLLIDLRKVTGGGAEAFWLRANQGLHLDVDKDMSLPDAQNTIAALKEQLDAYQHKLTRWLRTRGVNVDVLGSDVANFSNPADAILTQIAGAKAIPKRILTGSEMGELASSQDRENFRDQIVGRQMQFAGPQIVRPLVDRLIAYGYLPTPLKGPSEYQVTWPHIQVMTEAEKVTGAQGWASVNAAQGETVFTDSEIRDKWAGLAPLTDEQRQEIADREEEDAQRKLEQDAQRQETLQPKPVPQKTQELVRRAASLAPADEDEFVQRLADAIASDNEAAISAIVGVTHRAAGDYEGHPFHGNQWVSGHGGAAATVTAKHALSRVPEGVRQVVGPVSVTTTHTTDQASRNVDDYLMKHYGVTSSMTARALADSERGRIISVDDRSEVLRQYGHILVSRLNARTPGAVPDSRRHDFVSAFADVMLSEPMQSIIGLGSPLSGLLEIPAIKHALQGARFMAAHRPSIIVTKKDGSLWYVEDGELKPLATFRTHGGPGSGNFGHAGRPGEIGGSAPSGVTTQNVWHSPGGWRHTGITWKQETDPKTGRPIPIHVKSVEEAVQLVLDGKVVEVEDARTAHTLITKLADMARDAKEKGSQAPEYDLCQVTVKGSSMFCAESLRTKEYPNGVPRLEMPQLGGVPVPGSEADKLPRNPWDPTEVDGAAKFISHLQGIGVRTSREVLPAANLRASQRELVGQKVAKMMVDRSFDPAKNPIFISRDNYVVDGHHRWAAVVGRDAEDGHLGDAMMNVVRVDATISEVLHIANAWATAFGIQQAAGVKRQAAQTGIHSNIK